MNGAETTLGDRDSGVKAAQALCSSATARPGTIAFDGRLDDDAASR